MLVERTSMLVYCTSMLVYLLPLVHVLVKMVGWYKRLAIGGISRFARGLMTARHPGRKACEVSTWRPASALCGQSLPPLLNLSEGSVHFIWHAVVDFKHPQQSCCVLPDQHAKHAGTGTFESRQCFLRRFCTVTSWINVYWLLSVCQSCLPWIQSYVGLHP